MNTNNHHRDLLDNASALLKRTIVKLDMSEPSRKNVAIAAFFGHAAMILAFVFSLITITVGILYSNAAMIGVALVALSVISYNYKVSQRKSKVV